LALRIPRLRQRLRKATEKEALSTWTHRDGSNPIDILSKSAVAS